MSTLQIKSYSETIGEDTSNPYPHPLYLVSLPLLSSQNKNKDGAPTTKTQNDGVGDINEGKGEGGKTTEGGGEKEESVDMLAYGGDDGCIYLLNNHSSTNTKEGAPSKLSDGAPTSTSLNSSNPIVIRKYDDEVKSIAVSNDGLRIAVGFDDGNVKIYSYDNFINNNDSNNNEVDGRVHHPFIPVKALTKGANKSGGDDEEGYNSDDGNEGFLSQADLSQDNNTNSTSNYGEEVFDGPRVSSSIRQLTFDPRSSTSSMKGYYLAIVSEDSDKPLLVVDVTSSESVQTNVYLGDKSCEEYDGGGIRSLSYTTLPFTSSKDGSGKDGGEGESNTLLSTLGMDGKVITWDVSSTSDPDMLWDIVHKDMMKVVTNNDIGESSPSDVKACKLLWDTTSSGVSGGNNKEEEKKAVLFMPGKTDIQYRVCPLSKKSTSSGMVEEALTTMECKQYMSLPIKFIVDSNGLGHADTIVCMAVQPFSSSVSADGEEGKKLLLTGGKDGKLLLWDINLEDGSGSATPVVLPPRRATTGGEVVGIPPITSIVWHSNDKVYVAFADGTVSVQQLDLTSGKEEKGVFADDELLAAASKSSAKASNKSGVESEAEEDSDDDTVALDDEKMASIRQKGNDNLDVEDEEDALDTSSSPSKKETSKNDQTSSPEKNDDDVSILKSMKKDSEASKFIDDEAEDGDDDEDAEIQYDDVIAKEPTNAEESNGDNADDNNKDKIDEDMDMFDTNNDPLDDMEAPAAAAAYTNNIPLQPAFAPSSTPLTEPRRILCWNHVGVITLRSEESEENETNGLNLVDITFHETAGLAGGRRPASFTDNMGFIVGTLGDEGAMFASDLQEEEEDDDEEDDFGLGLMSDVARKAMRRSRKKSSSTNSGGSQIYYYRFETFGRSSDKDWVMALPDGERAMGCATGDGFGAVITSRRFLRLFTISGMQGPVLWIPGTPVTVVGRGRFVAVFYHRSVTPAQDGTQLLGYSVYDGLTGATVADGEVSGMSPGSKLDWVGFSEKCVLSIMDSDGMLSMLARYPSNNNDASTNNGNWMPLLDTVGLKKSTHDMYWPVEVHGGKLVCVLLRGGKEYPDAGRRPVTTTLNLRIPLATSLTAKSGAWEETSNRAIFALNQDKVLDDYLVSTGDAYEDEIEAEYEQKCAQVDKVTMKLFNTVVQAGKVERAFDLVKRLHSEKVLDVAITWADRQGQRKLSDRIEEYKLQKYPPIEDDDQFDDSASFDSGAHSERSANFAEMEEDEQPVITTRKERMQQMQRISPDAVHTPRQRSGNADAEVEGEYTTDEESPPREELKRKFDASPEQPIKKARVNPFAKKKLESPARPGLMSNIASPSRAKLSRQSTFATSARKAQRKGKQIV